MSTRSIDVAMADASRREPMLQQFFPEIGAGGFARRDGTVEFYTRVNALLRSDTVLLDFGAGRGVAHLEDGCAYRRGLRQFKGRVGCVYGVDVDSAVLGNPSLDQARLLEPSGRIPLSDRSVDLVLADWVLEHVPDPATTIAEISRVLRPGGWICARTPNRWNYQYLAARLIPDRHHAGLLQTVQQDRKEIDVFPKYYRLNDRAALRRYLHADEFDNFSYYYSPPPAYLPENHLLWRVALFVDALTPPLLRSNLFVFARRRGS